jgi:hypothetical protein
MKGKLTEKLSFFTVTIVCKSFRPTTLLGDYFAIFSTASNSA